MNTPGKLPQQELQTLRILWVAMLMSQLIFIFVTHLQCKIPIPELLSTFSTPEDQIGTILFTLAAVIAVGVGYYRFIIQPNNMRGISMTGSILAMAMAETCSIFGLIHVIIHGSSPSYALFVLLGIGSHAMMFPIQNEI